MIRRRVGRPSNAERLARYRGETTARLVDGQEFVGHRPPRAEDEEANGHPVLSWFAEIEWANENHGPVTPAIWRRFVRFTGISEKGSDRHFERIKEALVQHHIPHRRVTVERKNGNAMIGIVLGVPRWRLDEYDPARKKRIRTAIKQFRFGKPPLSAESFFLMGQARLPLYFDPAWREKRLAA